jgi:hypothetical protein
VTVPSIHIFYTHHRPLTMIDSQCRRPIFDTDFERLSLVGLVNSNAEGSEEAGGHEAPVAKAEPLGARVEGNVGIGTLGVVVRRREASASSVEASLGDQGGRGTGGGAGEHLD